MPIDYYPTSSVEDLLTILKTLQDRKVKGSITEVAAAGVRTVRSVPSSDDLEEDIREVLFSLHLKSPQDWPDPYAARIRRTRTYYTLS